MSKIEVDKIDPQSGTDLELGTSGDTITIPAGVTFDSSAATNTLPSTVVTTTGTQTLTNKSIAATQLTGTITPSDSTVSLAKLTATGTKDATTFLRGDNTFQTISSDYVLLSSTTPSPANTFSIDGHFTSDYDIYKIYAIGLSGSSMSNTRLSYKMNVSGSPVTGYAYSTVNNSGTTLTVWADNTSATSMDVGYVHSSSGSTAQGNLEMIIYRPLSTDQTSIIHQMTAWDNGTGFGRYFGATGDKTARAISGITLAVGTFGTGNIEADRILVYGMKNS